MTEKRWELCLTKVEPGEAPFDVAVRMMTMLRGSDPAEFEHLRQFDTPEKIDAEIARLEAERKANRAGPER